MTKLTRRQQEFLRKFLDLYNQERELLHYTRLAEYIGVSKVSAYEMLRLLEERGMVEAEYYLPAEQRGPGRPSVMFRPTVTATQLLSRLTGGSVDQQEWEAAKNYILDRLKAKKTEINNRLVEELVARSSSQSSSQIFAAEMITAIILGLESLADSVEARRLREELKERTFIDELGLGVFTGLGMGLTVTERVNRHLAAFLLMQSSRFQSVIAQLSDDSRRQLTEFTREVMQIVAG